jgi:hypothetical protein
VIAKFPRILEYKSERTIRPRLDFLRRCGVVHEDLAKVGRWVFVLVNLSRCQPGIANAWQGRRGAMLDSQRVAAHVPAALPCPAMPRCCVVPQVFVRAPMALELRVKDTLEPRAAFLRKVLSLPAEALGKLIVRHPQVGASACYVQY